MKRKRNTKVSVVEESTYGTYVWEVESGSWIADDEGRYLSVQSEKNDRVKLEALKKAAHGYLKDMGIEPKGRPVFLSGHRKITDETYEDQKARQLAGLTPDPFDLGAMGDDLKEMKHQ